jgi:hypothetical protein
MPSTRVYPVTTHSMSSGDALSAVCILGIATLTMLVSSTDMNMPTINTASGTIQLLSDWAGVALAGAAVAGACAVGWGAGLVVSTRSGAAGPAGAAGAAPFPLTRSGASVPAAASDCAPDVLAPVIVSKVTRTG